MKLKNLLLVTTFLLGAGFAFAQSPAKFNYQAVARDAGGIALASQPVGIQISIRQRLRVERLFIQKHIL